MNAKLPRTVLVEENPCLATRIACSNCGGHALNIIGQNQVKCAGCRHVQWFMLDLNQVPEEVIVTLPSH